MPNRDQDRQSTRQLKHLHTQTEGKSLIKAMLLLTSLLQKNPCNAYPGTQKNLIISACGKKKTEKQNPLTTENTLISNNIKTGNCVLKYANITKH